MPFAPRARHLAVCASAALCLLCALRTKAQDTPAPAGQTIQVRVARVNVGVVVTDSKGSFVEGLPREAFRVFDNGAEQPITEFAPVEEPGQVLLLIEAGPAAYFLQDANLFAASTLLKGLSTADQVAIVRYTDAPLPILAFTADKGAAQLALDSVRFNLGFADLNLSGSLYTVLDWLAQTPGKKTIVLIASGVDTSPQAAVAALEPRLQTGDVRILCVSTSGPLRDGKAGSKAKIQQAQVEFADADRRLRWLADMTGGRAYFPMNHKPQTHPTHEMAQIIRHEYSLAFAPPVADGVMHQIEVKVNLAGQVKEKKQEYRVDHRKAYQAPKE